MFKIEDDVPIPSYAFTHGMSGERGRPMKYDWKKMQPGQSVLMPAGDINFQQSLSRWRRQNPDQTFFTERQQNGTRVWRVA